jgi:hypothetical protein
MLQFVHIVVLHTLCAITESSPHGEVLVRLPNLPDCLLIIECFSHGDYKYCESRSTTSPCESRMVTSSGIWPGRLCVAQPKQGS